MSHCRECEACMEDLDHHCGFFHKCIGGWQTWMFHLALTLGFLCFLDLMVLMAYLLM